VNKGLNENMNNEKFGKRLLFVMAAIGAVIILTFMLFVIIEIAIDHQCDCGEPYHYETDTDFIENGENE